MSSPESPDKLKVVLCWHMHQPQYRNLSSDTYRLPWTYLHGIKDYIDMAVYLEREPGARAVFNFTPILLEQILDYTYQIQRFFSHNKSIKDPLLAALISPVLPKDEEHCLALVKQCLKANEKHLIERFEPYQELAELASMMETKPHAMLYTNDLFLSDLITWYHLAWLAETTRADDERVISLLKKARGFSLHERLLLLRIVLEQLESIIPRYKALSEKGQIELSVTPYAHPILPLMLDLESARQAMPDIDLPSVRHYPGGEQRCKNHIEAGISLFEQCFGKKPKGCWPSEGAISGESLRMLSEFDFKWAASGQQVLHNSLKKNKQKAPDCLYYPYAFSDTQLRCFFRDDHLSDLIGFSYQNWHGDDAVNNLVSELENIAERYSSNKSKVVSIILDGENCWEYYPKNGYYFLTALYDKLSTHDSIELCTFEDCVYDDQPCNTLSNIVAGSWVYGTLSTWIGHQDKNRGWDALIRAKQAYDTHINDATLDDEQRAKAREQLAICEGSDWFWWFGDYNPSGSVSDFEALYREHLANLYRFLGLEVPEDLTHVMSEGSGDPENSGVMRRGTA